MAAGAPLIPEGALGIAALVDLLIALLDILALGVLLGLLWTYKHTLGAVISFLVDHTRIHTPIGSFSLLFPLEVANNNILSGMSTAALGLEIAGGRFFHALGVIIGWMVNLAVYSATTLEHSVTWLKHIHIPKAAKYAAWAAFPLAWLTKFVAQQIAKALPHERKAAHSATHAASKAAHAAKTEANTAGHAAAKAGHVAHAVATSTGGLVAHHPHELTLPKTWRALTARMAKLERRLHRAEAWTAAGALAVAMANVLGVSARCLRSGNVGKVARHLCGLSPRALEDLLGLLADALILANICQVITLLQEGLSFIEPEVTAFVTALETWACYGDTEKPPRLAPVALYRPAVTGVSLYLPQ